MWIVDDTRIGFIDANGVFHANGYVGGVVTVTASTGAGKSTTTLTVKVDILDNPIGLPPADQGVLVAGGTADTAFKWLYPYDQTVFPRGLPAPILQFGGTAAEVTYLKITLPNFSYQQFAMGSTPTRVNIPAAVWRGLAHRGAQGHGEHRGHEAQRRPDHGAGEGRLDLRAGQPEGDRLLRHVQVASRAERGRDEPPARAKRASGAGGLHGLSLGERERQRALGRAQLPGRRSERVRRQRQPDRQRHLQPHGRGHRDAARAIGRGAPLFVLSLTPDGSFALVNGIPPNRWPPFISRGVFARTGLASRLVDTATGQVIAAPSFTQSVTYAQTPAFSPDGKHVAFANGDKLERRVMSMMDFDGVDDAAHVLQSAPRRELPQETPRPLPGRRFCPTRTQASSTTRAIPSTRSIFSNNDAPSLPQYAELRLVELADKKRQDARRCSTAHLPGGAALPALRRRRRRAG